MKRDTIMYTSQNQAKSYFFTIFCIAASLFFLSGCSSFNETKLENSLGKDVDLIDYSYAIADDLLKTAYPPLIPRQREMALLTTTFVDNNNLKNTSHFGRLLQDNISSRFVQQGYTVHEVKLTGNLRIEEQSGETILSRNLNLLSRSQKAQAILIGTISHSQRTMYISARLVNPHDSTIISSNNYRLYMDNNVLAMFNLRKGGDDSDMIKSPSEPLMNSLLY
ncbi:MAG: FlgO family outer membrane protein [Desulfocapsaceae bacterium]|jgi:TolB-like protein|nr:FlgO family outer membrane protein [Desulfocapsaceae bacterium]